MTHPSVFEPLLLRNGDRMPLEEFLERWERMPELKFAELIEGVVHLASPVSHPHGRWDSAIQTLAGTYAGRTPGTSSLTNTTWLMNSGSAAQPDCSIEILPEFGGRSGFRKDLVTGAPQFAAEVCYSSRADDLGPKLALYQRAGVDEYLAILVEEQRFEWRILVDGSYQLMTDDAGVYKSRVLPGFWVDCRAFWAKDFPAQVQTLDLGLASMEHEDFAARLRSARESTNL